jgi:hypothetical protein
MDLLYELIGRELYINHRASFITKLRHPSVRLLAAGTSGFLQIIGKSKKPKRLPQTAYRSANLISRTAF